MAFFASALGQSLSAAEPDVPPRFDAAHRAASWDHFLNGIYGVCTTDGQPETIFLKQAGVMFIDAMLLSGGSRLSPRHRDLLRRAVAFLDPVLSAFAPHELRRSSRQRCILDAEHLLAQSAA